MRLSKHFYLFFFLLKSAQDVQSESSTWCGKAYQTENTAIPPSGQFKYPEAKPIKSLYLDVKPRYTIFLDSDPTIELLIDASFSNLFGTPLPENATTSFETLSIDLQCSEMNMTLSQIMVTVGKEINKISLSTGFLPARLQPYLITVIGYPPNSEQLYNTSTAVYVLPSRKTGSAVKIDNLYGGSYVQNSANNYTGWYPIYPNGMFADGSVTIPSSVDYSHLETYAKLGFNTINIVPDGATPEQTYDPGVLTKYWDKLDQLNMFNIFNLQFAYQNSSRIEAQVNMWKDRSSLYSYHLTDEPDGWHHPTENTRKAYEQIKKLDPYHPIQMVINCQNFYYSEYTQGADIVIEDAYPIGIDPTHSIKWNTPCNSTYGDCGCDNCLGGLSDVSDRLDILQSYQSNLEHGGNKPMWATIQLFEKQDYWSRQPSTGEALSMMMLAINHNAKGLTYWLYTTPNDPVIVEAATLGTLFQKPSMLKFLFQTTPIKNLSVKGHQALDSTAWIVENQMLVGIASTSYHDSDDIVTITLPLTAKEISMQAYGNPGFILNGNQLQKSGMKSLEINILILNLS
ncbi:BgTH12-00826 [Blumeria graminis f. sp. triticale]|nr:BgTH12-00826 [Blumeria graminis f. sp. triticale]